MCAAPDWASHRGFTAIGFTQGLFSLAFAMPYRARSRGGLGTRISPALGQLKGTSCPYHVLVRERMALECRPQKPSRPAMGIAEARVREDTTTK